MDNNFMIKFEEGGAIGKGLNKLKKNPRITTETG
jgi:hypothetical protein